MGPEPAERKALHDLESFCTGCDSLLAECRRSVRIIAPHLDIPLLNRRPVASAMANLTRAGRFTDIRILFCDSMLALKNGHRLIELSRRFPSYIQLKLAPGDFRSIKEAWLLCDDTGLLWRPDHQRYDNGLLQSPNFDRSQKLMREFDSIWERAQPDPEMRQLYL